MSISAVKSWLYSGCVVADTNFFFFFFKKKWVDEIRFNLHFTKLPNIFGSGVVHYKKQSLSAGPGTS